MPISLSIARAGVALALCSPFLSAAALAQAAYPPSRYTPPDLRPSVEAPGVSAAPAQTFEQIAAPAGSDRLTLRLGEIVIEGGFGEMQAEHDLLRATLSGGRVAVSEIFQAAQRLEQAYARAGYVLARVSTPRQTLREKGPLRIVVTDGFIENIVSDGVSSRVRDVVVARLRSLLRRPHLTIGEIEDRLLVAGDVPGLRLRSALTKGREAGGAVLIVEGEHRVVSGALGADNNLPEALGVRQSTLSFAFNSPAGFGEQVYASYGRALRNGFWNAPLSVIGFGASAPVGDFGLSLNPEFTASTSDPASVAGSSTEGSFKRVALRWRQSLTQSREASQALFGSIERIDQSSRDRGSNLLYNVDRYVVARIGVEWTRATPWGALVRASALASRGLLGRDGDEAAAANTPLSRDGASSVFSKASGDLRVTQPLFDPVRLEVVAKFQTGFNRPMLLSEQMSLDGSDSVSARASGAPSVDSGFSLRGELIRPFSLAIEQGPKSLLLSPYLFLAGGEGQIVRATIVEPSFVRLGAYGLGLRLGAVGEADWPSASVGVEVSRVATNVSGHPQTTKAAAMAQVRF